MKLARRAFTLSALTLGLGAVLTGCTASQRFQSAEAAFPPIGEFVTVAGGARVHYIQAGSGPDVVLIHGAGGNLRDYKFQLFDRLAENYRVTAFDRPGLGYTDRFPGLPDGPFATAGESPLQQAMMLRDAANQLGVTDPVVVGHSLGGIVTYQWALMGLDEESPVNASAIVSFAGVAMPWPGGLGAYYTINGSAFGGAVTIPLIAAFVPTSTVENVIEGTFAPQAATPGYGEYIGAPLALRPSTFRANVRQVNTMRPHTVEMVKRYPELTLPVEILHGTEDSTVPIDIHSDRIAEIIPTTNLVRMEGIGHMPHHVDPDAAIAAIDRAATRAGLR
ncbi:Pimeloyl-ACP methyl ester carboxylesterase [Loktanella fryxellensis]|uniref:Pimeloyl-ACP methyl ester carboxylesterase n=1 Tax=Loktanella fryxellensis TaxID=245187 RepID=A0A1H7Y7Z5_9RHOB|nr:alpha/beta hydrolase [Loktanella fryxellensis]SEM42031.1 Pimeloyl-ACP methyl ester carboxylesterase [Loktanella fryxellensis]